MITIKLNDNKEVLIYWYHNNFAVQNSEKVNRLIPDWEGTSCTIEIKEQYQDTVMLSCKSILNSKDNFNKSVGRKVSLARTLRKYNAYFTKEEIIKIWNTYIDKFINHGSH